MESTTAYSNEFLMAAAPGKLGHISGRPRRLFSFLLLFSYVYNMVTVSFRPACASTGQLHHIYPRPLIHSRGPLPSPLPPSSLLTSRSPSTPPLPHRPPLPQVAATPRRAALPCRGHNYPAPRAALPRATATPRRIVSVFYQQVYLGYPEVER